MRGKSVDIAARFQEQLASQLDKIEPLLWAIGLLFLFSALLPSGKRRNASRRIRYGYVRAARHIRREPRIYSYGRDYDGPKPIMRDMLSASELSFFNILKEAFPYYHVCPQVSFNALLTHGDQQSKFIRKYFRAYAADFVLYNTKNHSVEAIIELDDPSHDNARQTAKDAMRDDMFASAGYRVVRFDVRLHRDVASVRTTYYLSERRETEQF